MAKLRVKVSHIIDTGPLVVHNHETHITEHIQESKLLSTLACADPEKMGFSVTAAHANTFIVFVFNNINLTKGSFIEVNAKPDRSGLTGRIEGQFEVKLRPGVSPYLVKYGKDLDLRFTSITLNYGSWSGFDAYPYGIDGRKNIDFFFAKLPRIAEFSVK